MRDVDLVRQERARPLRLVAGVVEAMAERTAMLWFPFFREPANFSFAFVPAALLPADPMSSAWRDARLADSIRARVIAARAYIVMYAPGPAHWWMHLEGARGQYKPRRVWPSSRSSARELPLTASEYLDLPERRAVARIIELLEPEFFESQAHVDLALSSEVVTWTRRLANYLLDPETRGLVSRFGDHGGLPCSIWGMEVVRRTKAASIYWVGEWGHHAMRHMAALSIETQK